MKLSCIMPTANRRQFVPRAIELFLRQDYEDRELLIYDDGADCIADLVPDDPRIRYFYQSERRNVGYKRNTLCEMAQGAIIAHWDDDDWSAPTRLSVQAEVLTRADADLVGMHQFYWITDDERRAWKYSYPDDGIPWVTGSSFCYTKDFWRRVGFKDIPVSEDLYFVWADPFARIEPIGDDRLFVATVHGGNTEAKAVDSSLWVECPVEHVRKIMKL